MRSLRFIAVLLLAACGTKGPLTLPPPPKPPTAQPVPTAQTAPADNSSKTTAEAAQ